MERPHEQSPTFHLKCRIHKGLNKKGEAQQIIKRRNARAVLLFPLPYAFIHSREYVIPYNSRNYSYGNVSKRDSTNSPSYHKGYI